MLVVVPGRKMLGLIHIHAWSLLLGLAAVIVIVFNAPTLLHVHGHPTPTCNGEPMTQNSFCQVQVDGAGYKRLTYDEMRQRQEGDGHDTAVIWTMVAVTGLVISALLLLPNRKPTPAARRGRQTGRTK